jgi:integrase
MFRRVMRHVYILKGEKLKKYEFPDVVSDVEPGSANKGSKRKLPKDLITEEEVKLLANNTYNLRDRAIIMTLYDTGARIGELLLLKIGDVSFERKYARISIPFEGKTGSRSILVRACSPAISQWLLEHPNRNDRKAPLFCGIWSKKKGEPLNYPTIRKMLRETFKRAGVDKPSNPHQFRHSRATELAKIMTEAQLCQYMGWVPGSKEASTYVHLSGRDTDTAIKRMYGDEVEEEKSNHLKPIKCPRCGHVNDASNEFCGKCTLALNDKALLEYEEKQKQRGKIEELIGDRNLDEYLGDLVLKKVKEALKNNTQ